MNEIDPMNGFSVFKPMHHLKKFRDITKFSPMKSMIFSSISIFYTDRLDCLKPCPFVCVYPVTGYAIDMPGGSMEHGLKSGSMTEDGRRGTDDRRRMTDDGRQRTDGRRRKEPEVSGARSRRSEVGGQMSEGSGAKGGNGAKLKKDKAMIIGLLKGLRVVRHSAWQLRRRLRQQNGRSVFLWGGTLKGSRVAAFYSLSLKIHSDGFQEAFYFAIIRLIRDVIDRFGFVHVPPARKKPEIFENNFARISCPGVRVFSSIF
jgi:hypothetical protein